MSEFALIKDARVSVKQHVNAAKQNVAVITVSDKRGERYEHRFSPTSRVSKHLDIMTAADLQERLDHGTYFFVQDQLVDFRDGHYNGFMHSDQTIARFMDLLGYQLRKNMPIHRGSARKRNTDSESDVMLRKVWSTERIEVAGYQGGATFDSQMSFVWNPFVKTINAAYDLVRLVCLNGMIGLTSFLNTKVPLFNRWEEHLDIASRQIQNKVTTVVAQRVDIMSKYGCSVADCLLLEQHANERLYSKQSGVDEEDRVRLLALLKAVSPSLHLNEVYAPIVFREKNLAAQLPAHLTQFDVFNIATELRTHSVPTGKSSDNALDKFANALLFDVEGNYEASAKRLRMVKTDGAFGDPERAFFGQINGK